MGKIFALISLLVLLTAGCSQTPAESESRNLDRQVAGTLSRHPDGEALGKWYDALPLGSLEQEAARWILAWLPTSDLATLNLALLQEHVNGACSTYRNTAWGDRIPKDVWLHFVVPHRVSQEPLQNWRSELGIPLARVTAPYSSMEEAALAVNRWCRQQATYISTSGRDMGPLTTIARGLGRCEEEMILTICAMRAAGIPARACSTPYWTFTDDNHAWVEVWADGRWYYAESCDDRRCLNDAWFSNAASRTGFVRSVGYGEFDPSPEPLYRAKDGVTIVNSTSVYTAPFTLRVKVAGDPEADIYVNVLNYGTIRSIAKISAGKEIKLGPGSYALTAASNEKNPDGSTALLLKSITASSGDVLDIVLDEASDLYDTEKSEGFWLTYPDAGSRNSRQEVLVSDAQNRHHRLLIASEKADRQKRRLLTETETAILDSLPVPLQMEWKKIQEKPCASFSPFVQLVSWYREPEQQQALTWLLADGDDKDLLELDEATARSHVDLALEVKNRIQPLGITIPLDIFRSDLLALRIHKESFGDWRTTMPEIPLADSGDASLDMLLNIFRNRVEILPNRYFGNPMPPHHVWQLAGGTETDLKVAFVGLCRRNGFPARYRHGKVDVWLGEYVEVDPLPSEETSSGKSEDETTGTGWLDIQITRGGLPYEQAQPYRQFMISRPDEGFLDTPWWDPVLGLQTWDAGSFWFCATMRVPGGSAHGRLTSFAISPEETTTVTLPLDIDARGWDPGKLVDDSLAAGLKAALAFSSTAGKWPSEGLFLIFEPGEPATRMIPAVAHLHSRLQSMGLSVIPVLVGQSAGAPWVEKLVSAGLPAHLYRDPSGVLGQWLANDAAHGPVAALFVDMEHGAQAADEIILLRSGLDNGIDGSAHLALDSLH